MKLLCTIVFTLAITTASFAHTIYVPTDYTSIQDAIDVSNDGDTIMIAQGTYYEFEVTLLGKAITLEGATDTSGLPVTTIDAQEHGRVIRCYSGETNKTVIKNLTFTNGRHSVGAGMFSYHSSPTLINCTFINNTSGWLGSKGGGMYIQNCYPTLTGCRFTNNIAEEGGAIYVLHEEVTPPPTLMDCAFTGNWAHAGGGVFNNSSSLTLTNCTFTDNTAYWHNGGGIYQSEAFYANSPELTLDNCTFTGNTAWGWGGGVHDNSLNPPSVITNCTFIGNTANRGGGMAITSFALLSDCTFTNNAALPNESTGSLGLGGGLYGSSYIVPLENCILESNSADYGGGIYNDDGSSSSLTDTTICSNTATIDGHQIYPSGSWNDNGGNYIADICDMDGDGIPDNEDECPNDAENDADGDGICGDVDAFPYDENEWADSDADGIGDNEDTAVHGSCCVLTGCHYTAESACIALGGTWEETGSCDDCVAPPETCDGDINADGVVNIDDLLLLISYFGNTCM